MYIMTKLLSVARPFTILQKARSGSPEVNTVATLPTRANILATMRTGRRPTWSDMTPSASDPMTEPMKNMDWASAGFQLSLHTQCICHNKKYTCMHSVTARVDTNRVLN